MHCTPLARFKVFEKEFVVRRKEVWEGRKRTTTNLCCCMCEAPSDYCPPRGEALNGPLPCFAALRCYRSSYPPGLIFLVANRSLLDEAAQHRWGLAGQG